MSGGGRLSIFRRAERGVRQNIRPGALPVRRRTQEGAGTMTAWGIHRLADMIGSKNVAAQLPDKSWVRAVPEPFTGNRLKAAWTVLCGHAYAVEWPEPGDLEKALER
jgi:hypothetical protein